MAWSSWKKVFRRKSRELAASKAEKHETTQGQTSFATLKPGQSMSARSATDKSVASAGSRSTAAARRRTVSREASRSDIANKRSDSVSRSKALAQGEHKVGSRSSEKVGAASRSSQAKPKSQNGNRQPRRQRSKSSQNSRRPSGQHLSRDDVARPVSVSKHMCVHVGAERTQIAILEGKDLVEHYTTRKGHTSIAGNIYQGRVQNVLPGMEAAFVDIGTAKNGVLYVGDVQWDELDVEPGTRPRIEQVLQKGQAVLVQVTKDPMGTKGARLTTQISLPGRYLVLVPESGVQGISRRLPASERDRLRKIASSIRPEGFGLIIRTAAEGASEDELRADAERLRDRWFEIYAIARQGKAPMLLYEEPELVIKVLRETFGPDFKKVTIDERATYERIVDYLDTYEPELKSKVEYYEANDIPLFDRYHVTSQLQKALDRKVWLPSGGHVVIDRTEALTVIDVNTGKNVGKSNLEETVFKNNLEAAEEISRQLRLRDIGGIIVIDFIDMEIRKNRQQVLQTFRECLARDKTRTQVFDISELGLLEMTRKNVSEGLIEAYSRPCEACDGRGLIFDSLD